MMNRFFLVADAGANRGVDLKNVARAVPGFLSEWWRSAPTRLALSYALSGTVAMMAPFVVLFVLGRPQAAAFAALGGLNTILSNVGGDYRSRLFAMLLSLALGTAGLFIGCRMPEAAWLEAPVFAVLIFVVGMARVFGSVGIAAGMFAGIMFLIGLFSPESSLRSAEYAGYCLSGGLWAVFYVLAVWRVRPWRYLFIQLATCYEDCAELVGTLAAELAGGDPAAARRHLRRSHRKAGEAIRAAETALEAARIGAGHSHPAFDRMAMLLAAVSREAAAAVSLRALDWPALDESAARAWRNLFASWQAALASIARLLSDGHGAIDAAPMRAAIEAIEARNAMTAEARAPLRLAWLHLDAIAEAGTRVSGLRFFWRDALPRLGGGAGNVWTTFTAQFTFRSIIFHHALRVAVAAGFGLWISGVFDVAHRLWLPLTTIIVLQPEFGATWRRLWQRVGGTLAGVLIAGGLYFVLHGTPAELVVIAIFAYGTFFFIRSHYGVGVVMLTPTVVLLLGVLVPNESVGLIVARGVDTVLGGALALMAAYLLWPLWQRDAFLPQCAVALSAERDYLAALFALSGDDQLPRPGSMQARHRAERASDNADATLHRMLSEPRRCVS